MIKKFGEFLAIDWPNYERDTAEAAASVNSADDLDIKIAKITALIISESGKTPFMVNNANGSMTFSFPIPPNIYKRHLAILVAQRETLNGNS